MKEYRSKLKYLLPLLVLLLLQIGGLWLGIKSLQILHVVQQEIRVKSNPTHAVKFTLGKEEYKHYARYNGKELNIKGLMYDVISVKAKADSVEITALSDVFEARLMALMIKTSASSNQKNSGELYLLTLMHLQFIAPIDNEFAFITHNAINDSKCSYLNFIWNSNWPFDLDQPPENKRNIV